MEYCERKLRQIVQLYRNGPVDYKILGAMQQCVYKTKTCDIDDLQKYLKTALHHFPYLIISDPLLILRHVQ